MVDPGGPPIGREAELAAIDAVVDANTRGPAGVVVTGEPGIGKSVVLAAVVERLRARGWHVLTGRADPLERQIPYAALTRLVEPLVADRDTEVAAAAVALRDALGPLGGSARSDVEASFGMVCGQMTALVQALLEGRGVGLAVDDVDALDDDTLALLAILVRRLPAARLLLLGTSRTERPPPASRLADLVHRLDREATFRQVRLAELASDAIADIVAGAVGAPPDAALAAEIHRRAGGNPFFAVQMALAAGPDGGPLGTRGDALRERVTPAAAATRDTLETIAVLGSLPAAQLALLARLTGLDDRTLASALDELVDGGVLVHDAGGWQFTHDLVREAVYDGVGAARQHVLHRSVADALLAERAAGRPVDVLTLARHVSVAAQPGDADAATVLAEAADLTRGVAPRSAVAAYGRALDVLPVDDARRGSLLARQCRAAALGGTPADAAAIGERALALLTPGTERARTASVVINSLIELGQVADAARIADVEVGLARTPTLLVDRARVLWLLGRQAEALEQAEAAEAMPTESSGERLLVLGPLGLFAAYVQRPRPIPDIASEMLALTDELPKTLQLYAYAVVSYTFATSGYANLAGPPLERAETLLDEVGGTAFRSNILVARVFADWMHGRWDEAVEGIAASLAELEGASYATQVAGLHAIELAIRSARGERISDELLHERAPTPNFADLRAWSVAGVLLAASDLDAARAALDEVSGRSEDAVAYLSLLLSRRVDIEVRAGQHEAARTALKALEEDAVTRPHPWTTVFLHAARAQVERDADEARAAVAAAATGGYVVDHALAQLALAELDPGASDALSDAYRGFQSLGADPWRRRAGALMRQRGMKVPRQRAVRSGLLTEAEMKIAQLVQQGMRNRDIAAVLHYSPRTVEVYLSRIYAKLDVSSRLELARALDTRVF